MQQARQSGSWDVTLEALRQLINDAQKEGYRMAIEDIEREGVSALDAEDALAFLKSKLKEF